jgi:preprotein translocase subunit SecG
MNSLYTLVVAIQVCTAIAIIGLVLVQHGKGADMGAAFGSGASGSLFGATGSSSFLSKATAIAATLFFCATLALAYLGNARTAPSSGVMQDLPLPKATESIPPTSATDTMKTTEKAAEQSATDGAKAPAPAPVSAPASSTTNQVDQIPK